MEKKLLSLTLCTMLFALCSTRAQSASKHPRLGFLTASANSASESRDTKAFRQGLAELGYVEGKNISIEYRSAAGKLERLPKLAAELVSLKVDIIVALNPPSARAAKKATRTIPIVMRSTGDPVRDGLVASLARPGGNITGLASISTELMGKRLELLEEVVARNRVVAVLRNPTGRRAPVRWQETEAVGRALGLQLQSVEVKAPGDFEVAFHHATERHPDGLITLRSPLIVHNRRRIAELAVKSRLAAVYDDREFADVGGLMSYGADLLDLHRRAATFVDKILRGAKPADLPVEQPTKFELIVNLKTAEQIGVTIPQSVLYRATEVMK